MYELNISERKKKILATVVEQYITTAEPVGSKVIAKTGSLGLSSATIRNELAELTALGYLEQPHTSSGRVPSPQGYRLYVNELMERQRLSLEETQAINQSLNSKIKQLDNLMNDVGKLTSSLTQYPVVALSSPTSTLIRRFDLIYIDTNTVIAVALLENDKVENKLLHLPFSIDKGMIQRVASVFNTMFVKIPSSAITPELIDSAERACGDTMGIVSVVAAFSIETLKLAGKGEAYLSGASNLLHQPEFRDPAKAEKVMGYLSESDHLLKLPETDEDSEIQVIIGPENVAEELKNSSVVIARYNAGDNMKGIIGVVGPTRMDYSGVAAKLKYIAAGLNKLLGTTEAPPGFQKLTIKGDEHINEH